MSIYLNPKHDSEIAWAAAGLAAAYLATSLEWRVPDSKIATIVDNVLIINAKPLIGGFLGFLLGSGFGISHLVTRVKELDSKRSEIAGWMNEIETFSQDCNELSKIIEDAQAKTLENAAIANEVYRTVGSSTRLVSIPTDFTSSTARPLFSRAPLVERLEWNASFRCLALGGVLGLIGKGVVQLIPGRSFLDSANQIGSITYWLMASLSTWTTERTTKRVLRLQNRLSEKSQEVMSALNALNEKASLTDETLKRSAELKEKALKSAEEIK